MEVKFTWLDLCEKFNKINPDVLDTDGKPLSNRISMNDVFDRPKGSKSGFPRIQKCKCLNRLNKVLINKNVAEMILNTSYRITYNEYRIYIRTFSPAKDGICLVNVESLNDLISVIGADNVVKIYNYIDTKASSIAK